MKNPKLSLVAVLLFACSAISCSKTEAGSELLDMGVSDQGTIFQVPIQSCVDASSPTVPPAKSLSAPALKFSGFSITWKSKDKALNISQIKISAKSNRLSGGEFSTALDSTEIEALLGAPNATLAKWTTAELADPNFKGHIYSSTATNKPSNSTGIQFKPCGLAAGGLSLASQTQTSDFSTVVTIKLYGSAMGDDGKEVPVFKTVTATAQYYN